MRKRRQGKGTEGKGEREGKGKSERCVFTKKCKKKDPTRRARS